MKIFSLIFTVFLIQFCRGQSNDISSSKFYLKNDSVTANSFYQLLVGRYLKVDSFKNPFMALDNKMDIKPCDSKIGNKNHFECIIHNFFKNKFPIEFGPKPEPNFGVLKVLSDSIFIVKSLGDKEYFKTEPGDRTAGYYYGSILDITDNYVLCLVPYSFCCGHEYYLFTIDKNGKMINTICVGGITSDAYETYGIIEGKDRFEVYKNEFGFEKGKAFLSKKEYVRYRISKTGAFKRE